MLTENSQMRDALMNVQSSATSPPIFLLPSPFRRFGQQKCQPGLIRSWLIRSWHFCCRNLRRGDRRKKKGGTSCRRLRSYDAFFVTRLCLPNEDFGRMNKRWNPDVRTSFQGCEYSMWATTPWKSFEHLPFNLLFILPKSSFGDHKDGFKQHKHARCIDYRPAFSL